MGGSIKSQWLLTCHLVHNANVKYADLQIENSQNIVKVTILLTGI